MKMRRTLHVEHTATLSTARNDAPRKLSETKEATSRHMLTQVFRRSAVSDILAWRGLELEPRELSADDSSNLRLFFFVSEILPGMGDIPFQVGLRGEIGRGGEQRASTHQRGKPRSAQQPESRRQALTQAPQRRLLPVERRAETPQTVGPRKLLPDAKQRSGAARKCDQRQKSNEQQPLQRSAHSKAPPPPRRHGLSPGNGRGHVHGCLSSLGTCMRVWLPPSNA